MFRVQGLGVAGYCMVGSLSPCWPDRLGLTRSNYMSSKLLLTEG